MSPVDHAVSRAIAYLVRQHEAAYPDAVHVMGAYSTAKFVELYAKHFALPAAYIHKFSRFRCEGRAFHVALITDALQDAADAGHKDCQHLVEENAAYLRTSKDGQSWRYFPGFEPLPYDGDSLGVIAQVLVRAGRARPEDFEGAFALAAANAWDDGAVSTFFCEAPDPRQRIELNRLWGRGRDDTGRDAEVVANLMYGALLYERHVGPCALAPRIHPAVTWLLKQQQPMGFWRASWYVGMCYSTYTAVRLLCALGGHERATDQAARFLAQAGACDPLNRALTVLALGHCGQPPARHDLDLIVDSQFPDGSWEAIPLLDNHARVWGSRAVTTGFCLKALLAAP
ncbi:hypothetical protein ACH429_01175 [Streptomyces pathocidini]|uniref:Squalene cyclase C-terminal domain-containing protein n=1 Tax=Streptomyces pathocidini TaxID=1650571 RepID=A0ABW7UJA4_9ACTN|nr:hypothetical protein [Streptomyces pathocidini]